KKEIETTNIAFQLLPERFTLTEMQKVYEAVYQQKLDKRNFRKKIKLLELLKDMHQTKMEGAHRPAKLYSFKI
ncbi:MAG: NUDIX hydrolase, partial [Nanoarchaeota archaeon]|nr:NUDIX hydrolase [Nanoarchaeota archaeon]